MTDQGQAQQQAAQEGLPEILRYFAYGHLPEPLRTVSARFAELAYGVADYLPDGDERKAALRKLLESKDAAVRAALDIPKPVPPTPLVDRGTCCGASGSSPCADGAAPQPAGPTEQGEGVTRG